MSYSVAYTALPSLTINNIGYTFSAAIPQAVANNTWTSVTVTLPSGVWLCTMNAWTSGNPLYFGQGSDITISTIGPTDINPQYVATCGAYGGNQPNNTACSLTAVFTNPTPLYFNCFTSNAPTSSSYCGYSYTRLA